MAQSREEQLGRGKWAPQCLELRLFLVLAADLVRPGTCEEGLYPLGSLCQTYLNSPSGPVFLT